MKKLYFIAILLFASKFASAQEEYKAINGVTYHVNDTVRLGRGSAPNGDFLYLQLGGWAAAMGYDSSKGQDQLNIGRRYANTAVVVKKIKSGKIKGIKKTYFTVGGGNISNYNLYIDDAIQACEVTPCNDTKNTVTIVAAPAASTADELAKFKKLLDAGAITQAEYDAKKKQLLGL